MKIISIKSHVLRYELEKELGYSQQYYKNRTAHLVEVETDEGIEIKRVLPTVVGNRHFKEYTDSILTVIDQTEDVNSIGLKRSIGMGDVVVTEPIVRKIKEKWPNAKLTYYTAKPDVIKYLKHSPMKLLRLTIMML